MYPHTLTNHCGIHAFLSYEKPQLDQSQDQMILSLLGLKIRSKRLRNCECIRRHKAKSLRAFFVENVRFSEAQCFF